MPMTELKREEALSDFFRNRIRKSDLLRQAELAAPAPGANMNPIQAAAIAAHDKHFNPNAPWMVAGPAGIDVGDPLSEFGKFMPEDAYLVCAKRSDMRRGVWVIVAAKPGPSGVEFVRWMLDAEADEPSCFWGHYGSAADAIQAFEERT